MNLKRIPPWVWVAGGLYLLTRSKKPPAPASSPTKPAASVKPTPKPVPVARIYQKEGVDAYESVHMSVETPDMPAREMGAFQNRAAAEDVAKKNGWKVAP